MANGLKLELAFVARAEGHNGFWDVGFEVRDTVLKTGPLQVTVFATTAEEALIDGRSQFAEAMAELAKAAAALKAAAPQ